MAKKKSNDINTVSGPVGDFLGPMGWIPFEQRTPEGHAAHGMAMAEMPQFEIAGTTDEDEDKVDLTEIWASKLVREKLGFDFPGIHQYTGSCVGAGGGNAIATLSFLEIIRLGDPEEIVVPFWLLPYGKSRERGGLRGRGEGSFGSTFAEAVRKDGVIQATLEGLPDFKNDDGLSWYRNAELDWSDGARIADKWLTLSRKHLVQTTASVRDADDVEQAIRNLYSVTNASNLIPQPGEREGIAYGRVQRSGGHQTTFLAVWRHPKLGRIFKYVNQWGLRWGHNGACWIPEQDVTAICRQGDSFAFSQFLGFPAQRIDWSKLW